MVTVDTATIAAGRVACDCAIGNNRVATAVIAVDTAAITASRVSGYCAISNLWTASLAVYSTAASTRQSARASGPCYSAVCNFWATHKAIDSGAEVAAYSATVNDRVAAGAGDTALIAGIFQSIYSF